MLTLHGTTTVHFRLRREGDILTGSGTGETPDGKVSMTLDLRRAPTVHPLYETVAAQDAKLFDAFNSRDLSGMKRLFAPDL